jgi:hypothetical protein
VRRSTARHFSASRTPGDRPVCACSQGHHRAQRILSRFVHSYFNVSLPPAASGCRPSATSSSLLGMSSLARGPEPLQSLPSCQHLLPPRQQPVPRLPRLRLLPRHRRQLLHALRIVFTAMLRLADRRLLADQSRQQQLRAGAEGRGAYINDNHNFPRLRSGSCYNVKFSATTWSSVALPVP